MPGREMRRPLLFHNTIQFGESANNAIKLILRKAYGSRNMENMKDMIMLRCSNPEVQLPGRTPLS